jgi:hypothetical protein
MILLDVNVLVYAHREDAARHGEFRRWLKATLDSPSGCAVSELVLSGCLGNRKELRPLSTIV